MDKGLFELCKQVYEKFPKWDDSLQLPFGYYDIGESDQNNLFNRYEFETLFELLCPLYTSDYLLEKLPDAIGEFDDFYLMSGKQWNAGYAEDSSDDTLYWKRFAVADTPLKALLKLTLALAEAGEL